LSLAILIAAPLFAADKEKKQRKAPEKPDPAAAVLKRLEKANLTDEQVAKIKEMAAGIAEKAAAARAKAALTDEQKKAQQEIIKKAKEEGKSRKEVAEALKAAVKLTPEQEKAMEEARAAQAELMKKIMAMLTPEQKQAIGKAAERGPRGDKKPGEKKGDKKKDA